LHNFILLSNSWNQSEFTDLTGFQVFNLILYVKYILTRKIIRFYKSSCDFDKVQLTGMVCLSCAMGLWLFYTNGLDCHCLFGRHVVAFIFHFFSVFFPLPLHLCFLSFSQWSSCGWNPVNVIGLGLSFRLLLFFLILPGFLFFQFWFFLCFFFSCCCFGQVVCFSVFYSLWQTPYALRFRMLFVALFVTLSLQSLCYRYAFLAALSGLSFLFLGLLIQV